MMTDPGDAPVVKIYRIERRKARIIHQCCIACGDPILPGQNYDRHFAVDDTEGTVVWKVHAFLCTEEEL